MLAVPQDSELYTVLEFAFDACEKSPDYRAAWELCEERYKHYNWVHTYPNLASEVVAVYFAGNDYNKAMSILMMSGQDNDCTGGPVGHAYGAMLGLIKSSPSRLRTVWIHMCARWRHRASPPCQKRRWTQFAATGHDVF